ncbi:MULTISPECIES: DUF3068 domain-containing protein [Streptomyces]|uniref:DUF3068 domain-containing protein n=1 Tax=Streptomyces prasinus TaxID=67345 RepID=A0ABX6AUT2_9ACTN|nr:MULTISPECIES: DUF3068 domain-containing protein [Streptomyces]MCP3765593.1 DUF3068 domain-containing protein [Streptomyces sp. MAR25Y5]OBQ48071.1 hypothetical protein A4U61_22895 [Streptomyces sp. H-KF8]QEV06233.1 DUF3068 domain-containing protein [Streptomyces prasinus]
MRRTASPLSLIMLGFGTFLLVLAPLLVWYVQPRAAVNPIDIDTTAVYNGRGSVFDLERVETVSDQAITITQRVRGNVEASVDSGNAVWDVITTVDTEKSLPAADPHDALDFSPHRWVLDRETTKPVHCCEETPRIEGEAYLKFPFDVQKRSYQWWDNTLGDTVVMRYQGTAKVQGYTGYRFTASVPATKTGTRLVPGSLVDEPDRPQVLAEEWYSNHGIELVVDQATGRVVYAQTGPKRTLRTPGGDEDAAVLLDSEKLAFTTETQKEAVRQAKSDSGQLRLLGEVVPVGALVAGFVLAVTGGILVARGRKEEERPGLSATAQ